MKKLQPVDVKELSGYSKRDQRKSSITGGRSAFSKVAADILAVSG
jgi:hypothetical protein